jgi:trehalose synthase
MPFYPTPNRDDGYDISDYYGIDPRLGDFGDFTQFVKTADSFGIKVIADLVVNHTSIDHPWFQAARQDRESPYRNFYIWRDEPPEGVKPALVFPGEQTANWTFDETAKQYYFHSFYDHQPDLNANELVVREKMTEIMGFWLQQGIAGFRVDAVPFLIEMDSMPEAKEFVAHHFLRDLRSFLERRKGDAILLGEVNVPPHEQVAFFGDDDELGMIFNFYVNQHLYLALARGSADPVRKALALMPTIPRGCQWANFLKNHDEQNLDKLTTYEREEVFKAFAPMQSMRSYERGIRRRLPSMLNDPALLRLAYSLMFSLPGTPVLFYGEEIGMGDNLEEKGRMAVRTPMQWKAGPNGGFSTAPAKKLIRALPTGPFAPDKVNVAQQRLEPHSMLNWMERLIRRRKEVAEIGFGQARVIDCKNDNILAHACEFDGRLVIALHNFSSDSAVADLSSEIDGNVVDVVDLWNDQTYPAERGKKRQIGGLGYRWIRIIKKGQELLM